MSKRSYLGEHWNNGLIYQRKQWLSLYFTSREAIKKHQEKEWNDLPVKFKKYLNRKAADSLKNYEVRE